VDRHRARLSRLLSEIRVGIHENSQTMTFTRSRIAEDRFARVRRVALFAALVSSLYCHAGDVVFFRASTVASIDERYVEAASAFYGLSLQKVTVGAETNEASVTRLLKQQSTSAVIIAAEALPVLDRQKVLMALRRKSTDSVPLLILGVTKDVDVPALKIWSDGAIVGVNRLEGSASGQSYVINHVEGFTRQLSDAKISFRSAEGCSFVVDKPAKIERLTGVQNGYQDQSVFVRASVGLDRVFVACEVLRPDELSAAWYPQEAVEVLPEVAPLLMFIRYAGGEQAWHAIQHYANLTIDDAWLREPYGHLEYNGLLQEMVKHRFHSTIAFVPWNYDRSDPAVVSLIRNHPESYSISVHGDNHDHKEFTDYRSKPLALQVYALRQSLARMDRFRALTGIPYDKVMVFPHSIAPEMTLAALKEYNYEATANSVNVPMDHAGPLDRSFFQRPVTLAFGNLPSITRYSAEGALPNGFIAIQEFLDNPLLFYCHEKFFESGIVAFDGTADEVNRHEPNMRWGSLGEIASHLYLLRLRTDSNYDVTAFSSSISLENASGRDLTYYVRKAESSRAAMMSVMVDGRPYPYELSAGYLDLSIDVPTGRSGHISIEYKNDSSTAPVSISKDSVVVSLLRAASDFRDIILSRFPIGQWFVRFYYDHDLTPTKVVVGGLIVMLSFVVGMRGLRRVVRGSERSHAAG
jgi:hypothetical protein